MPFCPVCSANLGKPVPASCKNCGADFSSKLGWIPVARPPGKFLAQQAGAGDSTPDPLGDRMLTLLVRLVIAGVIWVGLALMAFSGLLPYGGAFGFPFVLLLLATIVLPIWVLTAL